MWIKLLKAIITCGGLGTRLLPFTKELPKEMAPVFFKSNDKLQMIPLIQLIFENLYNNGIREFCFVTGKTKRSIENHFTPDISLKKDLEPFFNKLKDSMIFWTTQETPNGFGDAVKYSESFIGSDDFILQAGDVAIIQRKNNIVKQVIDFGIQNQYDAILCVRNVSDPERHGIVELQGKSLPSIITNVEEKPQYPKTNLGIMPLYFFNQSFFEALNETAPGKNNEIQVTDAIKKLIVKKKNVVALRVDEELFWDVGTPESYWEALNQSYCNAKE